MAYYPPCVDRRSRSPRSALKVLDPNASGTSASFECGSFVRVWLSIDTASKTISDAGFASNGCGFAVAAADVIVASLCGSNLKELDSLKTEMLSAVVFAELEPFPSGRSQCLYLAIDAVREALADHRTKYLEEFRGENALVCTCFSVTEDEVLAMIATLNPTTVDEITEVCRAGGGCGSCRMLLEEMLEMPGLANGV